MQKLKKFRVLLLGCLVAYSNCYAMKSVSMRLSQEQKENYRICVLHVNERVSLLKSDTSALNEELYKYKFKQLLEECTDIYVRNLVAVYIDKIRIAATSGTDIQVIDGENLNRRLQDL